MGALAIPKISVEEYLALDRKAERASEYHDGEMFPVEDVSLRHAAIEVKLIQLLGQRLPSTPCRVATRVRVRVSPTKFVYPDLFLHCGKPELTDEHQDTITNPKVIIEILSPSTEDYDYGRKFRLYQRLPSFEEYVLVSQDEKLVEVSRRVGEEWLSSKYEGEQTSIPLKCIGIEIPLSEIYADL